jgi:hypothetical protein
MIRRFKTGNCSGALRDSRILNESFRFFGGSTSSRSKSNVLKAFTEQRAVSTGVQDCNALKELIGHDEQFI